MNDRKPADNTARELRRILELNRECPPADTLIAFREDELSPGDGAAVAAHLGNCTECARLIEQVYEGESTLPPAEDEACRTARNEDRHLVAKALGFRVGRPPARPLFERLSRLWEVRVPALLPTAVCALLLAMVLWPAPAESPVSDFNPPILFFASDQQTRNADGFAGEYNASLNTLVMIQFYFLMQQVDEGTMVSPEVTSSEVTRHLEPRTVVMSRMEGADTKKPCVEIPLRFRRPGTYYLRLSHPETAFATVVLKIKVSAN